jgi:hypothetical protein
MVAGVAKFSLSSFLMVALLAPGAVMARGIDTACTPKQETACAQTEPSTHSPSVDQEKPPPPKDEGKKPVDHDPHSHHEHDNSSGH